MPWQPANPRVIAKTREQPETRDLVAAVIAPKIDGFVRRMVGVTFSGRSVPVTLCPSAPLRFKLFPDNEEITSDADLDASTPPFYDFQ